MNARAYEAAGHAFYDADREVKRLAAELQEFATAMVEQPNSTCFATMDGDGQPSLAQLVNGRPWDATLFPTPAVLQAALRKRHEALLKQRSIYEAAHPATRCKWPPPSSE